MLMQSLMQAQIAAQTRNIVLSMISQVNMLVLLFNNLLDRRMIKLGKFKQSKELFDPKQAISFIIDIYSKQA